MAAAALRDAAAKAAATAPKGKNGGKKSSKGGGKGFGRAATAAASASASAPPSTSTTAAAATGPVKVVVTGCLAQRYGAELAESLPEADLVVGFEHYGGLPAALASALGTKLPASPSSSPALALAPPGVDGDSEQGSSSSASSSSSSSSASTFQRVRVGEATVPFRPEADRVRLTPRHSAYLRVAEGCSHACTFCAIPGFR